MAVAHGEGPRRILIANRSEIALRLIRTYSLFQSPKIETVAIFTESEKNALHVRKADHAVQLVGNGPQAYLDARALVEIAKKHRCWGVAPGYGFLSEDANFARLLEEKGIVLIGPTSEQLRLLGDKLQARSLAKSIGVPTLPGSSTGAAARASSLDEVQHFAAQLPAGSKVILKAVAGGGGRGIRVVDLDPSHDSAAAAVQSNYEACQREAQLSFGDARVYAELFLPEAKHVEVQILGDGVGHVYHFWERECSLQRKNQKLIEIAPSPSISDALRSSLIQSALKMAKNVRYRSLATFEFLVAPNDDFFFMEANPRIQVEHTITEQITGFDLAALQLQVSLGYTLDQLGLPSTLPFPMRTSIQLRINAESFSPDGSAQPEIGTLRAFNPPHGPNIRLDTAAHSPLADIGAYSVNPMFDSLLAKLIVTAPTYAQALGLADRALQEFEIIGCTTNQSFLLALLRDPIVQQSKSITATVAQNFERFFKVANSIEQQERSKIDSSSLIDPQSEALSATRAEAPKGTSPINFPITGVLIDLKVKEGQPVASGDEIAIVEAMKMEHVIRAPSEGVVERIAAQKGQPVSAGSALLFFRPDNATATSDPAKDKSNRALTEAELDEIRPELQEVFHRKLLLQDAGRKQAVAKRHARGYLTARENIAAIIDSGSWVEYGDFNVAAQRSRHSMEHLLQRTSGDGIVTGWATIKTEPVAMVVGDYLVLAGTQGTYHHLKLDRIFQSVLDHPAPVIFYAEGGGGRPGDTDTAVVAGLSTPSFTLLGAIRARGIPTIAVANGYVFAGNAALLGTCDLVIATKGGSDSLAKSTNGKAGITSIGMGGKAMIEGGGLGVFESDEIGPVGVHMATGGIDILVDSEVQAAEMAKRLFSLFTATIDPDWTYKSDPRLLRRAVPPAAERRRAYDIRSLINLILDDDSFVELGCGWGHSIVTGLGRIEGKPIAVLANNPSSALGGAIDIDSALKAMRLMKLLTRTRAMHLVSLCDTPGFMVGPEFERSAQGGGSFRVFGEWFAAAQELGQSGGRLFGIVVRNAYGLGAQAMLGGSTLSNSSSVSWPTGAFGGMGLEGAVRLGMKKELEAISDLQERKETEQAMVDELYKRGRAANMATMAEVDTVIDPADTRHWIVQGLKRARDRVPTYRRSMDARL